MTTISLRRAVLEVGPYMQYSCHAFTTASSSLKSACAKPVLPLPGADMFFQRMFCVLSVATCNANAKEFRSITVLFGKPPNF